MITGSTAAEIADSVRDLIDQGALAVGDPLPPVRTLAEVLGVNRNTVVSAYGILTRAGIVEAQGRAGTRVAGHAPVPQEGYAASGAVDGTGTGAERGKLRDIGTGNPDPAFIPDPSAALSAAGGQPILYGEPVIDRGLEEWSRAWMEPDVPGPVSITVTSGAVDAVERLLAQALTRDDAVALEDPCFLASIHTTRLGGYRAVPVPVDEHGMTVDGLRVALEAGVRAVVCTPRAQNPTGSSLTAERARQLREVLADYPFVLVIEDDYYSLLSQVPFHSVVGPTHRRWALVRSLSKFIGPDICVAVVGSDPDTAERLAMRLSPGTTWVSHLLQRTAHTLLTDAGAQEKIRAAGIHYAARNADFADRLARHGITLEPGDGVSLWVPVGAPAAAVHDALKTRGWLTRTGDDFVLTPDSVPSDRLRLTVHNLQDAEAEALVPDLIASTEQVRQNSRR